MTRLKTQNHSQVSMDKTSFGHEIFAFICVDLDDYDNYINCWPQPMVMMVVVTNPNQKQQQRANSSQSKKASATDEEDVYYARFKSIHLSNPQKNQVRPEEQPYYASLVSHSTTEKS